MIEIKALLEKTIRISAILFVTSATFGCLACAESGEGAPAVIGGKNGDVNETGGIDDSRERETGAAEQDEISSDGSGEKIDGTGTGSSNDTGFNTDTGSSNDSNEMETNVDEGTVGTDIGQGEKDTDSGADVYADEETDDSDAELSDTGALTDSEEDASEIEDASIGSDANDSEPDSDAARGDTDTDKDKPDPTGVVLEDWDMALAVDNQFDVYFGTPYTTEGDCVGRGTEWYRQYLFKAEGKKPTDHLYVVTTSDRDSAQGFIGTFTNVTRGKTVVTGSDVWQVFPAGAYEATNPYWPEEWPTSVLPTQEEVDVAIRYAQENDLWVTPFSDSAYDNDPETIVSENSDWSADPWGNHYDDIPNDALWIWYDSGKMESDWMPGPFKGANHDEFLVFRVAGRLQIVVI